MDSIILYFVFNKFKIIYYRFKLPFLKWISRSLKLVIVYKYVDNLKQI